MKSHSFLTNVNQETVGYLAVLAYACLTAMSGAIAHFQAVVKFRTKQRLFQGVESNPQQLSEHQRV